MKVLSSPVIEGLNRQGLHWKVCASLSRTDTSGKAFTTAAAPQSGILTSQSWPPEMPMMAAGCTRSPEASRHVGVVLRKVEASQMAKVASDVSLNPLTIESAETVLQRQHAALRGTDAPRQRRRMTHEWNTRPSLTKRREQSLFNEWPPQVSHSTSTSATLVATIVCAATAS